MNRVAFYALIFIWVSIAGNMPKRDMHFSLVHSAIIEKLLFFKHGAFKVFYGGPVDREAQRGVRWVMPAVFEDEQYKTRAVYEIAFVNCDWRDAQEAEILFIDVLDINIKLKNLLSPDYAIFSLLLAGAYKDGKYIVVRSSDIANVYYPDIFISSGQNSKKESDKQEIVEFLYTHFKTHRNFKNIYESCHNEEFAFENDTLIAYKPIKVLVNLSGRLSPFIVEKVIQKNDVWKVYYIISKEKKNGDQLLPDSVLLRIDSGCVSGQIYDDDSCDCLDQLHDALAQMAKDECYDGIIIHVPTHDGRGFGTAPKAETEIYKRGGKGRIHETNALDTVAAAQLLYGIENCYDLRSFDGVGQLLASKGISNVILLTDNVEKVNTLKNCGIEVSRLKTETNKASCMNHINAKKNSELYFSE